jgi:hypothetical protein
MSACLMISAVVSCAPSANAATVDAPASIDATGATDVTKQLVDFIKGVPDGSTISFPSGARYRIEGTLLIDNRKDLTFEGNGAEFFATTEGYRERSHWWLRNSDGITIRDVIVRGANPNAGTDAAAYFADREGQHGFDLGGARNVLLERVTVTDVYGDFVYIGLDKSGWSKRVTVRDSTFERNGRQGFAITAGEDVLIERNRISEVRRATFDIEPNAPHWGARRITISDNDIGPGRLNFMSGHGSAAPVEDIVVRNNRLTGRPMNISLEAPESKRRSNISIIGNVSDRSFGSPVAAIRITGFDGVTIQDNVIPLAAGRNMTGVHLMSSCQIVVSGNQFTNASQEVKTDGYVCANKSAPATTTAVAAPTTGSAQGRVPTTAKPSAAVTTASPTSPNSSVREDGKAPAATPSGESPETGTDDAGDDEESAALPNIDGRLVDSPSIDHRGTGDEAIWALVIGAVVSLAVLIPVSRRRS